MFGCPAIVRRYGVGIEDIVQNLVTEIEDFDETQVAFRPVPYSVVAAAVEPADMDATGVVDATVLLKASFSKDLPTAADDSGR